MIVAMKHRWIARGLMGLVLLSLALLIMGSECPIIPTPITHDLIGRVLDMTTGQGIDGVRVRIIGVTTVTTDADGKYMATIREAGNYSIVAGQLGYTTGATEAQVTDEGWRVGDIFLSPTALPVTVGAEGGIVETPNISGEMIQLQIPAGALTEDTDISVTPLHGTQIPGLPPPGKLSGAAVNLQSSTQQLIFVQPATMTAPLPFRQEPGSELSVSLFNPRSLEWEDSGRMAQVSEDGMSASVPIDHFSTYSIDVEGSYDQEPPDVPGSPSEAEVTYEEDHVWTTWESEIVYPDGIPSEIDQNWLVGTVEQQTGIRFSEVIIENLGNAVLSKTLQQVGNFATASLPPEEPPPCFGPIIDECEEWEWILVEFCCEVKEWVSVEIWLAAGGWLQAQVGNRYIVCIIAWVLSCDNQLVFPNLPCLVISCVTPVEDCDLGSMVPCPPPPHDQGGGGN